MRTVWFAFGRWRGVRSRVIHFSRPGGRGRISFTSSALSLHGELRLEPRGRRAGGWRKRSAINFNEGHTRANNAILLLGSNGGISVYAGIAPGQRWTSFSTSTGISNKRSPGCPA